MIHPSNWNTADGLILEPNAEKAVKDTIHNLALTAGPGAGKTEMLAQRADFLLRTQTCRYPKRILAISFKVDACRNLKERVQKRCGYDLGNRFDSYTFHSFAKKIIDRFRTVLKDLNALDSDYTIGNVRIYKKQIEFQDLIPLAIQILDDSKVALKAIRDTYSYVFLDEFQDCTSTQYKLIQKVFMNTEIRIVAVGDTKQKIMGWAGALEGIFSKFAEDFNALPLNLYRNFRSKPLLLRMQNLIISDLDFNSVMPEEQIIGDEGDIYRLSFEDSYDEAKSVVEIIERMINEESIPYSEIAILISKQLNLYAEPIMEELNEKGIPFRNEQDVQDLSVEPVARLIVDYLLCLFGRKEPDAWIRLMKLLLPFTDETEGDDYLYELQQFLKNERTKAKKIEPNGSFDNIWVFVKAFLQYLGIRKLVSLSPDYESGTRLKEVLKETKEKILKKYNEDRDLLKVLNCFGDVNAIRILTFHKSKGLEFETVIILAIEHEIFFGDQDENKCAFFVGVSRAKSKLFLTCSLNRSRPVGYTGRWSTTRTPLEEYLNYADSFISS